MIISGTSPGCAGECKVFNFERSDEPIKTMDADRISHFAEEEGASIRRAEKERSGLVAAHEAGHAVAAACFGRDVEYVQSGQNAHCSYSSSARGETSEEAMVICSLAGAMAASKSAGIIKIPDDDYLGGFFDKARRGESGQCDACHAAWIIWVASPVDDDGYLADRYRQHLQAASDLFDIPVVRSYTRRLARALEERTLLDHAEVKVLIDADALRTARLELLVGAS